MTNTISLRSHDPTAPFSTFSLDSDVPPPGRQRMHPPVPHPSLSRGKKTYVCRQTGRRVSASASLRGRGFSPRSLQFKCCRITLPFSSRTISFFASCHTLPIQTSQFNKTRVRVLSDFPPLPIQFSPSFLVVSRIGFLSFAFRPHEVQWLLPLAPAVMRISGFSAHGGRGGPSGRGYSSLLPCP